MTDRSRITVVENVYHVREGQGTGSATARFSVPASAEQECRRELVVGTDPRPLDTGWVTDPVMVLVENLEGKGRTKIPTEAQREDTAARVVDVGPIEVLPGSTARFGLKPGARPEVSCRCGTARIVVVAWPRRKEKKVG